VKKRSDTKLYSKTSFLSIQAGGPDKPPSWSHNEYKFTARRLFGFLTGYIAAILFDYESRNRTKKAAIEAGLILLVKFSQQAKMKNFEIEYIFQEFLVRIIYHLKIPPHFLPDSFEDLVAVFKGILILQMGSSFVNQKKCFCILIIVVSLK